MEISQPRPTKKSHFMAWALILTPIPALLYLLGVIPFSPFDAFAYVICGSECSTSAATSVETVKTVGDASARMGEILTRVAGLLTWLCLTVLVLAACTWLMTKRKKRN